MAGSKRGSLRFFASFKKNPLAWAATEIAVMQNEVHALHDCSSIASHCTNQLFKKIFFVFILLRRFYCMGGHGGSLLCKAENCALHSSGSIAFHCYIRLLRRFFSTCYHILISSILSSRQTYWFILTVGAIARQYFLHMWLSSFISL